MENKIRPVNGSPVKYTNNEIIMSKSYQGNDAEEIHVANMNTENNEAGNQDTLQRTLGYRQGFVLMIGLILGSGVFISPSLVAKVRCKKLFFN